MFFGNILQLSAEIDLIVETRDVKYGNLKWKNWSPFCVNVLHWRRRYMDGVPGENVRLYGVENARRIDEHRFYVGELWRK